MTASIFSSSDCVDRLEGLSGGRLFSMSLFRAISTAFSQIIEDCDGGSTRSGSLGDSSVSASLGGGEIWDVPAIGGAELSLAVCTENT